MYTSYSEEPRWYQQEANPPVFTGAFDTVVGPGAILNNSGWKVARNSLISGSIGAAYATMFEGPSPYGKTAGFVIGVVVGLATNVADAATAQYSPDQYPGENAGDRLITVKHQDVDSETGRAVPGQGFTHTAIIRDNVLLEVRFESWET